MANRVTRELGRPRDVGVVLQLEALEKGRRVGCEPVRAGDRSGVASLLPVFDITLSGVAFAPRARCVSRRSRFMFRSCFASETIETFPSGGN